MKLGYLSIALSVVLFGCAHAAIAQVPEKPSEPDTAKLDKLFDEANELMDKGSFAAALAKYRELLEIEPRALGPLYNGGMAAFELGQFESARDLWKRAKTEDPEDMQVRAKLIQTYQSLAQISDRDAERAELFSLHKKGITKGLADPDYYAREQSVLAGRKVIVFEHFELKTSRPLRYAFYILRDDGKPEFRISLGSYDITNNIWRETTKPKPKEGERLFHLDGYYSWGHATYGMYPKEPSYDDVRKTVIAILEEEKDPISSSTVAEPKNKPGEENKPR